MTSLGDYAIVEFVEEKAVEVVSGAWIETCDGIMYSYWPRTNATAKVKKAEMPDKESWKRYQIRVFSFADTYKKAQKLARKAEVTSHLESESDSDAGPRKRTRPNRSSFVEFPDWSDGDESDIRGKIQESSLAKAPLVPLMPAAPTFSGSTTCRKSPAFNRRSPPACMSTPNSNRKEERRCTDTCSTLPGAISDILSAANNVLMPNSTNVLHELRNSTYGTSSSQIFPSMSCSSSTSGFQNQEQSRLFATQSNAFSGTQLLDDALPRTPTNGMSSSLRVATQEQNENFQRSVLTKLDMLIEKQDEGISMLRVLLSATRGVGGTDMLQDVLPKPIDSVEDLEALSVRLEEEAFMKKMLQFLIAVCAHNSAVSTRRILAKLGTNRLWSLYSLKGRKSKLPFQDLAICRLVIKACLRVHKKANEVEIEEHIAEYLIHTPHKPGGSRYKKPEKPEKPESE